ncbi:hypothetical protein LG943_15335 [Streptomonospora sp. S1-112]|uniref:Uncharacterized protein n=1 Tax=Streptomonospora mangrovi TaxID=2883123 RepID=A0A9X3SG71_9ACTN|nr:hypothetical protein [Streptomonospora mangrovi]MDA0565680.1 hypothetical protein [Streptomonospora mangrovi]
MRRTSSAVLLQALAQTLGERRDEDRLRSVPSAAADCGARVHEREVGASCG